MKRKWIAGPKRTAVAYGVFFALLASSGACAEALQFDSRFLRVSHPEAIDLSAYSHDAVPAGQYRADIYLNDNFVMIDDVRIENAGADNRRILLSRASVAALQLKASVCKEKEKWCDPGASLPHIRIDFDSSEQRIDIRVPQAMLANVPRGEVGADLWDAGIPALLLGYNVNGYRSENNGGTYDNLYASLNSGVNIGSWYFRHNGALSLQRQNGEREKKYTVLNSYVQHALPAIGGNLLLGETNTSGQLFDSLAFTGVSVSNDERMLPASRRGYAPEIRGIAQTNAKVVIRQNGQLIYETSVAPGEFVINDLYPSGYGGNLNVTVFEADGSSHAFDVPYSSVAQLLRPGANRYSATVGKLRHEALNEEPAFAEVTFQRGVTNSITGYGGVQAASFYQSAQAGVALGTPVGAFSFDTTWSRSQPGAREVTGESFRLSYSKFIPASQTQFSLATWRYSTGDYLAFTDAAVLHQHERDMSSQWRSGRIRNRMTLTLNQGLPDSWGQLYVTGILQDYWGEKRVEQQYQAGYSRTFGRLNWSLGMNRSRSAQGGFQNVWTLSFTMPLGGGYAPLLTGQLSRDREGHAGEQVSITGSAGHQQQFSWNASAAHQYQAGSSGQVGGTWTAPVSTLTASYAQGRAWRSGALGMSGTAVAHAGGVTFSPWTGNTFGLVEAKGAEGAEVSGYAGTRIDGSGYALVPNLTPYQKNAITLDPTSVQDDVELESTSQQVVPYAGAVVKVDYRAAEGLPVLVALRRSHGERVPFSARAIDQDGQTVGYVGQGGRLYARLLQPRGVLELRWGQNDQAQCKMNYSLPSTAGRKLLLFDAICS